MKLQTKLFLFNTLSKLILVLVFVSLLPVITAHINRRYTDNRLRKQQFKILEIIRTSGIGKYMENGESYGSYTPLKEDYISLDTAGRGEHSDRISNEKRVIDKDTIEYRILSHSFLINNKNYLLEIGKSENSIGEITVPLRNIGLGILLGIVILTIIADLFYADFLLKPLGLIIKTKLVHSSFPRKEFYEKVNTSTSDFQYLDSSIHKMIGTLEKKFLEERELISNTSHELLTPVSILQSKIENLFEKDDVSYELKISLLGIQKVVTRIKTTVKTLLLVSQIENEQFEKQDELPLKVLLNDLVEEISIRLEELTLSLEIQVPETWVLKRVNKILIFNMFFNLINNAIKYNIPDGKITITGVTKDKCFIIGIDDTGIGIKPEQQKNIFNRFKTSSTNDDSFGLGLHIVKTIADFHNIQLTVKSVVDRGTVFTLLFPAGMILLPSELKSNDNQEHFAQT